MPPDQVTIVFRAEPAGGVCLAGKSKSSFTTSTYEFIYDQARNQSCAQSRFRHAFMFYGLATDKLDTGDLRFVHALKDIQTLNQAAMTTREYDVTAISFHA